MEMLPFEICLNIFGLLDHRNLAAALQVCRMWKKAASSESLWLELFRARWGPDRAEFFSTDLNSKSWKQLFAIEHRCDRYGLGLKIIREGDCCYLIHQGEIQRLLCRCGGGNRSPEGERCSEISDGILFFIGDLEAACADAKRSAF